MTMNVENFPPCRICGGEVTEGQDGDGQEWWPVPVHADHTIVDHHVRFEVAVIA